MAGLTKTYTRDLSTAIAGKLWEAIKDADETRKLEKSKASEEVKKAAVKIKKQDPNSIPVQDKDLNETVVKIFGPLEGKLLQTEGKVDRLSGKITAVAGSISDTQKLIINQNQLLEDKFDKMLTIIGDKSSILKQKKAEDKFKQLEMNLEGSMDLSKTFGYEKVGGRGGFGVIGAVLSNVIGRRLTRRITRNLYKSIVPKGLQSRARILGKSLTPFRRVARAVGKGRRGIQTAVLAPFVKRIAIRLGRQTWFRSLLSGAKISTGFRAGSGVKLTTPVLERVGSKKVGKLAGANKSIRGGIQSIFARLSLWRATGTMNPDRVSKILLDEYNRLKIADDIMAATLKNKSVAKKASVNTGKIAVKGGTSALNSLEGLVEGGAKKTIKKQLGKKTGSSAAKQITDISLSKPIVDQLSNPLIWNKISKKMGPEFMEKLGLRLGVSGFKTMGVGPGTAFAFAEGLVRLSPFFGGSDPMGMALSFGSAIPWGGWGVAIMDILRDIDREAFDQYILPTIVSGGPTDNDIAKYMESALGITTTPQYERGNVNITGGMGGIAESISEILGVTKAFGDAAGFGPEISGLIGEAGLSSYAVGSGNYNFDVGKGLGGGDVEGSKKKESDLRKKKKKEEEDDDENKPIIDDDRTSGEKIGDVVGATINEVDKFVDPARGLTNGKRDDGVFSLPFGLEIRNPLNTKSKSEGGGIGGNDLIASHSSLVPHNHPIVRVDASGEPGVDFTPDGPNNRVIFDGQVTEIGHQYNPNVVGGDGRMGAGYGNYVVVTSVDPSNGQKFDGLYAHFPEGAIIPSVGDWVSHGDILGLMATAEDYANPDTRWHSGSGTGEHTSFDMLEPGTSRPYSNWRSLVSKIDSSFNSPYLMMPPLPPVPENIDTSSISPNSLSPAMTGLVEKGSNERMMTKRKSQNRLPIVIINNQIINNSVSPILMGAGGTEDEDFFEVYNLARYTV